MLRTLKRLAYWLIFLPLATLLLMELALQGGTLLNQKFLIRTEQTTWISSRLRVVAMGDSNTYGLYLDRKDTYPKQLETIWNNTHPQQPIEVINIGYPGANSSRIIANIEAVIQHFQPDIILVMIGTNDSWTAPITEASNSLDIPNPINWLKIHSRTYRLFCIVTRQAFDEKQLEAITTSDPQQKESAKGKPATINYHDLQLDFSLQMRKESDHFDSEVNTTRNFEKLIHFARDTRHRIIFLTYAADKTYYRQANKVLRKTVEDNQYADFIDVTQAFAELQPAKGSGNDYFFPDLHATAGGNRIVAEAVTRGLEHILLSSASATTAPESVR